MAFNIIMAKGDIPNPQIVPPAIVVAKAGDPQALGVTIPIIKIDLTGVSFKQRAGATGPEFSFDFGTMTITLRQEIYLANDLTACELRKWGSHERGHVDDNRKAMDDLQAEFMQYGTIKDVFVNGVWYPRTDFSMVQRFIQDEIGDAYRELTAVAAAKHDSITEYRRVAREILRDCPEPIMYTIQRGDTLSGIALHYYGVASKWTEIHTANLDEIGPNANLIITGRKLRIPKI